MSGESSATDRARKRFQRSLGTRVDALAVALRALAAKEPEAVDVIRKLGESLLASAEKFEFTTIAEAARKLVESADEDLAAAGDEAIGILRGEASKARHWAPAILVIGGAPSFNDALARELAAPNREVVFAGTAEEADEVTADRLVAFVVLNLILPDEDGRSYLLKLRGNPVTASIPIAVLSDKAVEKIRDEALLACAKGCLVHTGDPQELAELVKSRLRRANESPHEAWRDPLTGLLNRAAFRETFGRVLANCLEAKDPLACALIAIDGARSLLTTHGLITMERVVQKVGALLSGSFRATDSLARWGVYEFAAFFPGEEQFGGIRAVEKVMDKLRCLSFDAPDGTSFCASISAGLAVIEEDTSVDEAVAEADRYLRQAQSLGGGRALSNESPHERKEQRVLLVLHEEVTARVVKHLIEKEGMAVTSVTSKADALAASSAGPRFHLIVVAEKLADSSGFEALDALRQQPQNNRVPILSLLSRTSPEGIVRALELGASDYVVTPFAPMKLMSHVRALLTRGAMQENAPPEVVKLLIIDEDVKDLILAASALHHRGWFQVYLGKGAEDGLARFHAVVPHAVIVPDDLVDGQGSSVLQTILAAAGARPEVIVSMANVEAARLPEGARDRVKGTITRPFSPLQFVQEIDRLCGVPPGEEHVRESTAHLNAEIQRVIRMSTQA